MKRNVLIWCIWQKTTVFNRELITAYKYWKCCEGATVEVRLSLSLSQDSVNKYRNAEEQELIFERRNMVQRAAAGKQKDSIKQNFWVH